MHRTAYIAALGLLACMSAAAGAAKESAKAAARPAVREADWCKSLVKRLPGISVAACQATALKPSGAVSRKGFPILSRDIPAGPGRSGKEPLRILLLGGIHGDELTSAAIVFQWMQWMQRPPADGFHWSVAPIVNPDGLLARRPQRMNANGVDLNRNFPTPGWEREAPRYWAARTRSDPRRYPGPSPLSEPETRWLDSEMERFQPHVIVSVHAPFGVLDFDGPAPPPERFGRLQFNRVGVYPGSLGNYGGLHKNVPVITIELPHALKMPPQDEVRRIWMDMLRWIAANVPREEASPIRRTSARR